MLYSPKAFFESQYKEIVHLLTIAENHYVEFQGNRIPLHAHPERKSESSFFFIPYNQFQTKSFHEIQNIHATKHIIVLNAPYTSIGFTEEGMSHFGYGDNIIQVQGMFF